jgi:hypothetical protein
MGMESKQTRLGNLILKPNAAGGPATGPNLEQPPFISNLLDVFPEGFSGKRYKTRPTFTINIGGTPRTYLLLHEDYPFESAIEIPYTESGSEHYIWIIYGSGGK